MKQGKRIQKRDNGYTVFLKELKHRIHSSQTRATMLLNRKLIELYLEIGKRILEQQKKEGWGKSIVERLSGDLRREFPDMKGFSPRNLWDMRRLYESVKDRSNLRQVVAEIPWGHNLMLLNRIKDPDQRTWYIRQAVEHGWSRAVLAVQIESDLHERHGNAITNFSANLPEPQSDLARQTLKDPYLFDFLTLTNDAHERDLERGLLDHIQDFLLELGVGFAFVGRQVHLEVGEQDFYIDLLFYHLRLRCFVLIDLKTKEFKPEYAGKMNFYLSAVDDILRHPDDNSSIGLILCQTQNRFIAEYALRDMAKPMGVAEWKTRLVASLPKHMQSSLPTISEIEAELRNNNDNQCSEVTE